MDDLEQDKMKDTEEMLEDVQELIKRHRMGSPGSKKRERDLSPKSDESGDSLKTPRNDEFMSELNREMSGHYIFRAARPAREDMLDFIRKNKPLSMTEDKETADLVSIIRGVETFEEDDIDSRLVSHFTRNLVKKGHFDSDSSSSESLDAAFDKILHKEFKVGRSASTADKIIHKEFKFEKSSVSEHHEVSMVTEEMETTETNVVKVTRDISEDEQTNEISTAVKEELDFSLVESTSPLNVDASKQKVVLRQKGSLANRRKPTRSTLRSSVLFDIDLFEGLNVSPNEKVQPEVNLMNGHDEVFDRKTFEQEMLVSPIRTEQRNIIDEVMSTSPTRTEQKFPNYKAPVVLPGIADAPRPKLRSIGKPPSSEAPVESTSETPPWLAESRSIRKTRVLPPKPATEKTDTEPEKPAWMKDALAKRKKVADILQAQQEPSSKESSENDEPPLAPWMKERQLKKMNRPEPLKVTHRESISNVENTVENETVHIKMSTTKQELIIENDSPRWSIKMFESPRSHFSKDLTSQRVKDTPSPKRSSIDAGLSSENIVDENTPPRTEKESFILETESISFKPHLPPISNRSQSLSSSSSQESAETTTVPSWKTEIQQRKKSKSHIPSQRLDQPMTLTHTPQWKKDLVEKNKTKPKEIERVKSPVEEISSSGTPAWKQELAHRKKRVTPRVLDPIEKTSEQPEMDWKKQAEKRRQRLASKGFLASADEDVVG